MTDGLKAWTKYGLLWLALTFVLRVAFFFMLKIAGNVEWSAFLTVLSGVYFDLTVVFFVSAVLLIPSLVINRFLPKTFSVLSIVFITLYVVGYCGLMGYYSNVMQPLDRVFFVYSLSEQYDIVISSVRFSLLPIIGVLAAVFLYALLLRFWNHKVSVKPWLAISYTAVTILYVIVFNYNSLITNDKNYKSHRDYTMAVNQMAYTIDDFYEYYKQNREYDFSMYDGTVLKDALAYQRRFPDFNYVDIHYPFLRENNDPDVLGCFLDKTSDGKAPDFVFLIVEGLGQRLSSFEPKMSFTPFLDSLKKESLYWPNCMALAERTFGVVPNVFSSAPYDKSGFAREWWPIPDHNSILKDMSKNGYSISFYFGGNAAFDGQDTYMAANGVGYMMNPNEADFDQENKEKLQEGHSWGMSDRDMFNAAIKHRDTVDRNRPNTDIYITLSTHEPFYFKGQEPYVKKVRKMLAETTSFGPKEKENVTNNADMYAAYLYSDECLKELLEYYKTKPEYENTVFVIFGDHRTACVWVGTDHMLAYNVPLIIYSPLLKAPKTFKGVVTHHDLAPTINAYLHKNYDYNVDDECHWLGTSLDTSSVFRCNQSVAFMLNNRDVVEYLHNNHFLYRDRLYELNDSMTYKKVENDSIKNQLKEYLRQYKNIDRYVTRNDFLLKKPGNLTELLNFERVDEEVCHIDNNTRQKICDPIEFDGKYERIYIDAKISYKIKNGVNPQDVFIEFYTNDKDKGAVFYKAYRFSELSEKADNGNILRVKTTFFIINEEITNNPMFISIFTRQDLDIDIRDVNVKVEGLPVVQ